MRKYTKTKVIRISEEQHNTLQKMKSLNIDVGKFIRSAIAEKIEREKPVILKPKKEYCPF
jgi:non-homologous end joining protein Ku